MHGSVVRSGLIKAIVLQLYINLPAITVDSKEYASRFPKVVVAVWDGFGFVGGTTAIIEAIMHGPMGLIQQAHRSTKGKIWQVYKQQPSMDC